MMDEAAAREIERLKTELHEVGAISHKHRNECDHLKRDLAAIAVEKDNWVATAQNWRQRFLDSERQRKQLSEYIETLAKGGIEAATGAGK